MSFGKQFKLNSGYNIPTLGYGTWQAAPGEVGAGVYEALKAGYRHLDLAKIYQNQKEVAQGIKNALADVPGLKREDIFITSKLWNNKHKPEEVQGALEETLQELELDYLDLYLIHWPVAFASGEALFPKKAGNDGEVELYEGVSLTDTWRAMIELLKLKTEKGEKKVRSIGVSNFTVDHLETIINDTNVVPAANQVERHPRLPQPELVKYCKDKNILITGYSAFGNNSFGLPLLVNTPEVKDIAKRLSASTGKEVTGAQVILAWSQLDNHSVIPKSVTPSRIRENFQEIELDQEAIDALKALGQNGRRFNIPTTYSPKWDINIFNDEEEKNANHKVILKV